MLQHPVASDYVLATGRTESVQHFVELATAQAGFAIEWEGSLTERRAIDRKSGDVIVEVNAGQMRPAEVDILLGDAAKAKQELDWEARTSLAEMVSAMVEADMRRVRDGTLTF